MNLSLSGSSRSEQPSLQEIDFHDPKKDLTNLEEQVLSPQRLQTQIHQESNDQGPTPDEIDELIQLYPKYRETILSCRNLLDSNAFSEIEGVKNELPDKVYKEILAIYIRTDDSIQDVFIKRIDQEPLSRDILFLIAEYKPKRAIDKYLDTYGINYKQKSYSKKVFMNAITSALENEPNVILEYKNNIEHSMGNRGIRIIKKAIDSLEVTSPGEILLYKDFIKKNFPDGPLKYKQILESTSIMDPFSVIHYYPLYQYENYAQDILKKSFENGARSDPVLILMSYLSLLNTQDYKDEIISLCMDTIANKRITLSIRSKEITLLIISNTLYIKQYPHVFKLALKKLTNTDPQRVIALFSYYKNMDFATSIIDTIADNYPYLIILNCEGLADYKNLENCINNTSLSEKLRAAKCSETLQLPDHPRLQATTNLFEGLKKVKSITMGRRSVPLSFEENINIYNGILKTYLSNTVTYEDPTGAVLRDIVVKDYKKKINTFIEKGKQRTNTNEIHVCYVAANNTAGDDNNYAFTIHNDKTLQYYSNLSKTGSLENYSSAENPQTASVIIDNFEQQIHDNPNAFHIFYLGAHGSPDGSVSLKGGNRTKENFERLFSLSIDHPDKVRIDLSSCFSGHKDDDPTDNTINNIALDSGKQLSYNSSSRTILEGSSANSADFDKDGIVNHHEVLLHRILNYNDSLTPTSFDDGKGNRIDIATID